MHDPDDFPTYMRLADDLIEKASKHQVAEVSQLLALNIGWYHERYGDVPQDELRSTLQADTLSEEGMRLVLHGMQNLLSALAEVMGSARMARMRHGTEGRRASVSVRP